MFFFINHVLSKTVFFFFFVVVFFLEGGGGSVHSKNFHSYVDVTIIREAANVHLFSTVTRDIRLKQSSRSRRTRSTHIYCREFSIGAVTTCFLDLGFVAAWIRTLNLPLAGRTL